MIITNCEQNLLAAQEKAWQLIKEIENRNLIVAGATESEITAKIYDLALELFGTKKHWHKRIVRSGPNTVFTYKADPPDRVIENNDLVYLDIGPVFDEFEGDVGKTYLVGHDSDKEKLLADLERIFAESKKFYLQRPEMTGAELWSKVVELTQQAGWLCGNSHAGHIVGEFPHDKKYADLAVYKINDLNNIPMNTLTKDGHKVHWILEIHLVDQQKQCGGFFEDLLSL